MSDNERVNSAEPRSTGLTRTLSFRELVFLSFGGQAALLSLLTYATGVLVYASRFSPIAIVLGTTVVLLNAVPVYGLSRRYAEAGGYYIYALYTMTRRLGLETGWVYIFYSVIYGAAYIMGAAYVLQYAIGLHPMFWAITIFVAASIFLALGIRPSARYAEIAAVAELIALIFIAVANLAIVGFKFYNPFSTARRLSPSLLATAILFAVGIPTGYGSITPLGGEALKREDIGRAALLVVVLGGLLSALVVYSIIDAGMYSGKLNYILSAKVPIMDFLRLYYREFALIILLFAAFNDGVLASLSFMAATSRTIYAMAKNNMLPYSLSSTKDGHPFNAVLAAILAYSLVVVPPLALAERPFELFLVYGGLAGMANLFVHISADVSFVIQEGRTMKRALTYSSLRFMSWIIRRSLLIMLGLAAIIYSVWTLTLSMGALSVSGETYLFLLWIIVGFIYAEVIDELMGRVSQSQSS